AMAMPVIHHRTPQFGEMLAEVQEGLRELLGTANDVLVLAASGTGAMEGSVTNLLSAGDEAIVVNGGKFGERWTKICQGYGVAVHEVAVEWGRALEPAAVTRALEAHPKARALFVQASAPSTSAPAARRGPPGSLRPPPPAGARDARRGDGPRPPPARPRGAEPGRHRDLPAGRSRRQRALPLPARPHPGDLRRGQGSAQGK